ncbi:MAG: CAP domain-containing protein [Desulfobaccales bacterium]
MKKRNTAAMEASDRLFVAVATFYFVALFLFFFLRPPLLMWWYGTAPPPLPPAAAKNQDRGKAYLPIKAVRFALPAALLPGLPRLEDQLLQEVNRARQTAGYPGLTQDAMLLQIARAHSKDMGERNYFSHKSPEGITPEERVRSQARQLIGLIGENIYMQKGVGQPLQEEPLTQEAQTALMNNPRYRANILGQDYNYCAVGGILHQDAVYITQLFANVYAWLDDKAPAKLARGKELEIKGKLVRDLDTAKVSLMLVDVNDTNNKTMLNPKWEDKIFKLQVTLLAKPGLYSLGLLVENTFIPGPLVLVEL